MLYRITLDKYCLGLIMDSYIVRIISRPGEKDASMRGIIEDVENKHKTGFTSQEELWKILRKVNVISYKGDCLSKKDK